MKNKTQNLKDFFYLAVAAVAFVFMTNTATAQNVKPEIHRDSIYEDFNNSIFSVDVVEYPGMSADQIKEGVEQWIGSYFMSAEGVIKSNTQSSLTMTPIIPYVVNVLGMPTEYRVKVQVHFQFKDEKMRITMTEIPHLSYSTTLKTNVSSMLKDNFLGLDGKYREVVAKKGLSKGQYKMLESANERVVMFNNELINIDLSSLASSEW